MEELYDVINEETGLMEGISREDFLKAYPDRDATLDLIKVVREEKPELFEGVEDEALLDAYRPKMQNPVPDMPVTEDVDPAKDPEATTSWFGELGSYFKDAWDMGVAQGRGARHLEYYDLAEEDLTSGKYTKESIQDIAAAIKVQDEIAARNKPDEGENGLWRFAKSLPATVVTSLVAAGTEALQDGDALPMIGMAAVSRGALAGKALAWQMVASGMDVQSSSVAIDRLRKAGQEKGLDPTDPEQLLEIVQDRKVIENLMEDAANSAEMVGLFDVISGGIASKVGKAVKPGIAGALAETGDATKRFLADNVVTQVAKPYVPKVASKLVPGAVKEGLEVSPTLATNTLGSRINASLTRGTIEGAGGAGGEIAANLRTGDDITLEGVAAEALAGGVQNSVAFSGLLAKNQLEARRRASLDALVELSASGDVETNTQQFEQAVEQAKKKGALNEESEAVLRKIFGRVSAALASVPESVKQDRAATQEAAQLIIEKETLGEQLSALRQMQEGKNEALTKKERKQADSIIKRQEAVDTRLEQISEGTYAPSIADYNSTSTLLDRIAENTPDVSKRPTRAEVWVENGIVQAKPEWEGTATKAANDLGIATTVDPEAKVVVPAASTGGKVSVNEVVDGKQVNQAEGVTVAPTGTNQVGVDQLPARENWTPATLASIVQVAQEYRDRGVAFMQKIPDGGPLKDMWTELESMGYAKINKRTGMGSFLPAKEAEAGAKARIRSRIREVKKRTETEWEANPEAYEMGLPITSVGARMSAPGIFAGAKEYVAPTKWSPSRTPDTKDNTISIRKRGKKGALHLVVDPETKAAYEAGDTDVVAQVDALSKTIKRKGKATVVDARSVTTKPENRPRAETLRDELARRLIEDPDIAGETRHLTQAEIDQEMIDAGVLDRDVVNLRRAIDNMAFTREETALWERILGGRTMGDGKGEGSMKGDRETVNQILSFLGIEQQLSVPQQETLTMQYRKAYDNNLIDTAGSVANSSNILLRLDRGEGGGLNEYETIALMDAASRMVQSLAAKETLLANTPQSELAQMEKIRSEINDQQAYLLALVNALDRSKTSAARIMQQASQFISNTREGLEIEQRKYLAENKKYATAEQRAALAEAHDMQLEQLDAIQAAHKAAKEADELKLEADALSFIEEQTDALNKRKSPRQQTETEQTNPEQEDSTPKRKKSKIDEAVAAFKEHFSKAREGSVREQAQETLREAGQPVRVEAEDWAAIADLAKAWVAEGSRTVDEIQQRILKAYESIPEDQRESALFDITPTDIKYAMQLGTSQMNRLREKKAQSDMAKVKRMAAVSRQASLLMEGFRRMKLQGREPHPEDVVQLQQAMQDIIVDMTDNMFVSTAGPEQVGNAMERLQFLLENLEADRYDRRDGTPVSATQLREVQRLFTITMNSLGIDMSMPPTSQANTDGLVDARGRINLSADAGGITAEAKAMQNMIDERQRLIRDGKDYSPVIAPPDPMAQSAHGQARWISEHNFGIAQRKLAQTKAEIDIERQIKEAEAAGDKVTAFKLKAKVPASLLWELPRQLTFSGDISMSGYQGGLSLISMPLEAAEQSVRWGLKGEVSKVAAPWMSLLETGKFMSLAVLPTSLGGMSGTNENAVKLYQELATSRMGQIALMYNKDFLATPDNTAGPQAREELFKSAAQVRIRKMLGKSKWTSLLPNMLEWSANSYTNYMNAVRLAKLKLFIDGHPGIESDEQAMTQYMDHIMNETGRGVSKYAAEKFITDSKYAATLIAAPRLQVSRTRLLATVPEIMRDITIAEGKTTIVQRQILKQFLYYGMGFSAVAIGFGLAGWELDDDPLNRTFGKFRKEDATIDATAGLGKWIRLFRSGVYTVAKAHTENPFGKPKASQQSTANQLTFSGEAGMVIKGILHPILSSAASAVTGQDFMGKSMGTSYGEIGANFIINSSLPIGFQEPLKGATDYALENLGKETLFEGRLAKGKDFQLKEGISMLGINFLDYHNQLRNIKVVDYLDNLENGDKVGYNPAGGITKRLAEKYIVGDRIGEEERGFVNLPDNNLRSRLQDEYLSEVEDLLGAWILKEMDGPYPPTKEDIEYQRNLFAEELGRMYYDQKVRGVRNTFLPADR